MQYVDFNAHVTVTVSFTEEDIRRLERYARTWKCPDCECRHRLTEKEYFLHHLREMIDRGCTTVSLPLDTEDLVAACEILEPRADQPTDLLQRTYYRSFRRLHDRAVRLDADLRSTCRAAVLRDDD